MRLGNVSMIALVSIYGVAASPDDLLKVEVPIHEDVQSDNRDNRLRRSHKTTDTDDKDTTTSDNTEERAVGVKKLLGLEDFGYMRLFGMKINKAYKLKMFKQWNQHKVTAEVITNNLNTLDSKRYRKLLLEYLNTRPAAPDVAQNQRIHFGENTITKYNEKAEKKKKKYPDKARKSERCCRGFNFEEGTQLILTSLRLLRSAALRCFAWCS